MTITTTENSMLPVRFDAPLVEPSPQGLYAATTWTETAGPTRWLAEGVQIRPWNYGGSDAFGVWGASWCALPGDLTPDDLKTGTRPDMDPDPFLAVTVWSYDECDLTAPSRDEVRLRAQQIMRLEEQPAVERSFAARLLTDASVIASRPSLVEAVGYLEGELAKTNTVGLIHASPALANVGGPHLVIPSADGPALHTMLGHRWVFGGGYVDGLGSTLVATSPVFGWRDAVAVREAIDAQHNVFAAIAERSVLVGYEMLVAAVTVTEGSV